MISEERIERWVGRWQQGNGYHVLLGLLLSMFVLITVLDSSGWGATLLESVLLFTFLEALTVVTRSRMQRIVGLILAAPSLLHWAVLGEHSLIPVLPEAGHNLVVQTVTGIGTALFLFYLVALTVADIFRRAHITWSQISAAASSYLLLGVAWKGLYEYLHRVDPTGSFHGLGAATNPGDFLYFSFVTMTTLGYGDIVPVTLPARMLVVLQAVIGQLFLVILVARLVGMVGNRPNSTPKDE